MTKIAIPSMSGEGLEADVCAHFGSCECFTIVDVSEGSVTGVESVDNSHNQGAQHNCMAPAVLLRSHGVEVVLVSGIGGRPLMSLNENMIKVFMGAVGKVGDAVLDYHDGLLQELIGHGTCNCSHH